MSRVIRHLSVGLCLLAGSLFAQTFSIHGTTDKEVAIYSPGEPIVLTLRVLDGGKPVAGHKVTWTRTGDDGKTEKGEGIADEPGLKVTVQMDQPGFVRVQASAFGPDGKKLQGARGGNAPGDIFFDGGACVEPEKLAPIAEPEDFDAFWAAMRATLDKVPIRADREELPCKNPKVKLYAVTLDCAGPKPVTGYLSIPADAPPQSLPAVCEFHGYGVRRHNPPGNSRGDAIVFNVNAHGMELDREDAYYDQLIQDLKGYAFKNEENQNPETAYFYGMSLRVMRALQYVKSLPEWNGKELQSNGGSQGGLQGLWGAGLDPEVTSASIWSPWCCDLGGITVGRLRGWRPDYTRALDYFDPVFHAKRIKGKVHLIANYGDYTCPPAGVWIVYNQIPHDNKSMEVKQGCTHGFRMKSHLAYTLSPQGVSGIGTKD
ncbi:MAG: acetylxylan esterase [Lentisphaeria bacterium]|jgi:cephalosporin-C deacetylase-like acetyl esterase|nr:acetylxylan esterase [Lentisphaeria bacterium]